MNGINEEVDIISDKANESKGKSLIKLFNHKHIKNINT